MPARSDAAALWWLLSELSDGPLLECLRRRSRLDKHLTVEPPPPRAFAWNRWKTGERVCWEEVFPAATPMEPVVLTGQTFRVGEWYCANPQCGCHDLELAVSEFLPEGRERFLGGLKVDFGAMSLFGTPGRTRTRGGAAGRSVGSAQDPP